MRSSQAIITEYVYYLNNEAVQEAAKKAYFSFTFPQYKISNVSHRFQIKILFFCAFTYRATLTQCQEST